MKENKSGPRLVPAAAATPKSRSQGGGGSSPVHPFDRARGTDTGGLIPATELRTGHSNDKHVTAYYGVAPSILRTLIELWLDRTRPPAEIDRYTFVDIGSGKGRAVLVAAESPFQEVVGIELNPDLAAIAHRNLALVRSAQPTDLLAPITLLTGDALSLPLPSAPTLLHLFHPFEAPALRRLLRNVERDFSTRPGTLDLLYVNAEHAAVLDAYPAFTRVWSGPVAMSTEDHLADLQEISTQLEYGSTGDEQCAIYRYVGRGG